MKSLKIVSLAALLAVALVSVSFTSAEAKKADTSEILSPKSYGQKTFTKVITAKSFDDQPIKPISYKAEQQKAYLKLVEAQKAQELVKKKYGL
ncbi:hypothetical protein [Candidatus Nitrosotenuis aquarius]|uniref:hypothetical protein n=1 Tax=Candidatus Nitrosotenuis aquarius TaxID=1846278 RepID=UPI000C1EA186|nr:hypothetical protein [Candidatus Nitrosotenuis aquarius]